MEQSQLILGDTVALDELTDELVIIDQTLLPDRIELLRLSEPKAIYEAIYELKVRGAPAIGVAAAIGIYVVCKRFPEMSDAAFVRKFSEVKNYLASSRPTAVNLTWALDRMERVVFANSNLGIAELKKLLRDEAMAIRDEDIEVCRAIGEHGFALLSGVDSILTHCNAGRLAAVRYGTALAPVYIAKEHGKAIKVFSDETRPLLQGARLTACELHASGIEVSVICDNMASSVMKQGMVQAVFVGCDRVAANGDTANKIGTSAVAILARHYGIPFYVCAPLSTIDMACADGSAIEIEQRDSTEVTEMWYEKRMAPNGVEVYNPAFDITEAELITAFITEKGVVYPPFEPAFREFFNKEIK
ncbi:MAG: S-methyl-5-thioribose-1-phosphate isomerase [Faecalimonas sp.]|nr:S-methyl-5-thioribose-1-phosphate isomerase [Faecalimonas sp.]